MSRNRQYTRKELESLRRADLQNLYKIHGLKGANQKSDALIDTLVIHFSSAAYVTAPESPNAATNRRLKSIDLQTTGTGRITKDVPRRPATAASSSRVVKAPARVPSRLTKRTEPEPMPVPVVVASTSTIPSEWEERLQRMEEVWTERLKQAEAAFEEKLRLVEEKWEARWTSAQPNLPIHPSPPASTPRVVITDPSPMKRPLAPAASSSPADGPARKRLRSVTASEASTPPPADSNDETHVTPSNPMPDPHTPTASHQGTLEDMSRTPGVGDGVTGLPYPVFATTPKPADPRSPTLDAPPSASRQRAWSSNSMPKMLTPGRKRTEVAPRAVSQAHMDLSTITESDEAPIHLRRNQTPPVLFPPSRSRDRTTTPPRLSPSPSITERGFQHPSYPSRGSSLVPQGPRPRQTSTPAREYMDVALHGLPNPVESPGGFITPGHRTILGTERYRDTRFGDIPTLAWGSPNVDFGSATPQAFQR